MSHRLAPGATAEQRFQLGGLRRRQRRFAKGENIGPRPAGHVTQQDFGIPARAFTLAQADDGLRQPLLKSHHSCSEMAAS